VEKRSPHCRLSTVKELVSAGKIRMTASAVAGAEMLELDRAAIIEVVKSLKPKDFYKSMTTQFDHRIWQDVYRPTTSVGSVYLKLTVMDDVLVVSFKEV
jgi:motility quorum-sensing regulator/GCU-specific mRNA interferase toxin